MMPSPSLKVETMRVYKFLSVRFVLKALRDGRIKISQISELNDPFETIPVNLTDEANRVLFHDFRDETNRTKGVMCFSREWKNPVLWAHYADRHRGACLGFDVPEHKQRKVEYVSKPYHDFGSIREWVDRVLFTKFEHWAYEDEIRMWANLEEKHGDHYFENFGEDLSIKEVVLGSRCQLSRHKLNEVLRYRKEKIAIRKARLALDAFSIVEDEGWTF